MHAALSLSLSLSPPPLPLFACCFRSFLARLFAFSRPFAIAHTAPTILLQLSFARVEWERSSVADV